jgi:DNA-binding MarR family transcriptional regulator
MATAAIESGPSIAKAEYERLARFRYALRRFLRFSEEAALAHGITPQQHQLLLAAKGFPGRDWATVRELAERLQRRHPSVVGVTDRAAARARGVRVAHRADRRVVEVHVTEQGERVLGALTAAHREELARMRDELMGLGGLAEAPPRTPP